MSGHTKEPWDWSEHKFNSAPFEGTLDAECGIYPPLGESGPVAIASGKENARRIVACVNACAGIPTDDLEACPDRGLFHLADHANQLVIQRDELLAALENLLKAADLFFAENEGLCGREQARAAIASAKGGAA